MKPVPSNTLLAGALRREPVSRIFGFKEFWSLPLQISDAVLVPRPDTETVVEEALDGIDRDGLRKEPLRILDIGTGSGAIVLALLSELPNAVGTATDISDAALAVARGNAERLGFAARCDFVNCDVARGLTGPFDLIVSNPPYIAHDDIATLEPEVRDYDPAARARWRSSTGSIFTAPSPNKGAACWRRAAGWLSNWAPARNRPSSD